MGQMTVPGYVVADVIDVRFAYSGKLAKKNKWVGDRVKRGELLASLSTKLIQAELDRELADYEEIRAEWEIFNLKNKDANDPVTQYLRKIQQARLNSSVKEVEIAKEKLEEANLISPVNGSVVNDGGTRVSMNVTPSANAFEILDSDSYKFRLELTYDKMNIFITSKEATIIIPGINKGVTGKTKLPLAQQKDRFVVDILLPEIEGILRDEPGEATIQF